MVSSQFLQSHSLFGGILDDQLAEIKPFLQEVRFSTNDTIITEGEEGDRLYFLCEGCVEILKDPTDHHDDVPQRIAVLGPGDTFGEMELIDIQCRAATVRALEPVTALTLSNADLYRIYKKNIKTYTMIVLNLARDISRRLRKMDALAASALYSAPPAEPCPPDPSQGPHP